ncbi:MAG: U32 family peptidase, partial [Clostridia bacterium]|nr:U32 family peptidase [Clostridia bacterium]
NFDTASLREAVTHAHRMGSRVYLTLNTLVWDRELSDALEAAYEAAVAGVDALIIADLGAAALIRRALPNLPLHASTQLSGHNAATGQVLADFGFSRFVIARETSLDDLAAAVRSNPLEVEVFIHGALCVSHSGQCLFSSVVGGRSGNRGECAQPCRLPYGCGGCDSKSTVQDRAKGASRPNTRGKHPGQTDRRSPDPISENYPLSLKDLSLAGHVPALIEAGVSSLKIEGRMKSPGYVSGVTAIWRRLLDEGRAATPEEMAALGDLFSRGGFTDGYQVGKVNRSMMGVRTDSDKDRTAAAEKAALGVRHRPHLPLSLELTVKEGQPVSLTATAPLFRCDNTTPDAAVTVTAEAPDRAESTALTREAAEKQLTRTGGTPYYAESVSTHVEDGLSLPLSRLNALRREALEALDAARMGAMPTPAAGYKPASASKLTAEMIPSSRSTAAPAEPVRTARFYAPEQITPAAMGYFDLLYLPLGKAHPAAVPVGKRGILMPPVVFDREAEAVRGELTAALQSGIRHILVGNIGHLPLIRECVAACGLTDEVTLHGDLRLNTANTPATARLLGLGLSDLILSPELTIPRMRDISAALSDYGHISATAAVIYGRLPLMLLEKCAIREIYRHMKPEAVCREVCGKNAAVLRDRMGKEFPVLREDAPKGMGHRNLVCNSLPTGMSDRMDEVSRAHLAGHHFIFTVETSREVDRVIAAYREGKPLGGEVRRMVK